MKKKISIILLLFLVLCLFGCKQVKAPIAASKPENVTEDAKTVTEEYNYVCVDISGDEGYYAFMADTTKVEYYDDKVVSIYVQEPTLLAYQVAEKYADGVGIIDGTKVLQIKQKISEHLNSQKDDKTKELLSYIYSQLDSIMILTTAST